MVSLILSAVLVTDVTFFGSQIFSMVWETRTGFHRDLHGIRFHVPLFYTSSSGVAYDNYSFTTLPSRTRHKLSFIVVDFQRSTLHDPPRPLPPEMLAKIGERLTGERKTTLAGRKGDCLEYAYQDSKQQGNPVDSIHIECYFGPDLRTSFQGSPNTVEEFYDFMHKAEPLPRKN